MITLPAVELDIPTEALPVWHRVEAIASPAAIQAVTYTPAVFAGALLAYGLSRTVATGLWLFALVAWKPLAILAGGLIGLAVAAVAVGVAVGVARLFGARAARHVWRHLVPRPNWHRVRMAIWGQVLPTSVLRWAR